jgi:hypothetical protein
MSDIGGYYANNAQPVTGHARVRVAWLWRTYVNGKTFATENAKTQECLSDFFRRECRASPHSSPRGLRWG